MAEAYKLTREYKAVYVLNPTLEEEQINTVIEKFQELVKGHGAEVTAVDKLDKKRLAYEVKGFREGYYVAMNFTSGPKVSAELERAFKLSDNVLRFIVVRTDEV